MIRTALAAAAALLALHATSAAADPASSGGSCFRMSQLQSTRPDGDSRIYLRVGVNTFYRIDLAFRCPELQEDQGLVMTPAGGRDEICTPLDLDLRVRLLGGGSTPCMIKSIAKLTPEEAAAIPKKAKP
jgi:hypothetical protein